MWYSCNVMRLMWSAADGVQNIRWFQQMVTASRTARTAWRKQRDATSPSPISTPNYLSSWWGCSCDTSPMNIQRLKWNIPRSRSPCLLLILRYVSYRMSHRWIHIMVFAVSCYFPDRENVSPVPTQYLALNIFSLFQDTRILLAFRCHKITILYKPRGVEGSSSVASLVLGYSLFGITFLISFLTILLVWYTVRNSYSARMREQVERIKDNDLRPLFIHTKANFRRNNISSSFTLG